MKPTERVPHDSISEECAVDGCTPPSEGSLGIGPDGIDGPAWCALAERARDGNEDAYRELYLRLEDFRHCFTRQLFANSEGAYSEFVRELVDQIRYGFLRDPDALLAQARAKALRKTAERVRSLTSAARVLSTLPKRHREVLIRAQLERCPSPRVRRDCNRAPARRARATAR
jgi:hypothetical protein